ncbi:YSIRK-type signal peptide-containing protein, partial [Limosilactobacillus sp. WF-MT5-A]
MLSKNNRQEQFRKQEQKKQRFAIKKLTVGVASVLIGFTFMGLNASASADDTPTQPANNDNNVQPEVTNVQSSSNVALNGTSAQSNSDAQANSASAKSTNTDVVTPVADKFQSAVAANFAAKSAAQTSVSAASNASVTSSAQASASAAVEGNSSVAASSSAAKDDNVITSNGNGVVTGQNSQGTWAAMDETQGQTVAATNWNELANALNSSTVTTIDLQADINVDNSSNATKRPNPLIDPTKLQLTNNNISREVTINGNGHIINFGDYYITQSKEGPTGVIKGNRSKKSPWKVTFNDVTINANNTNPFGFDGNTAAAPSGDAYDNQKYDLVKFNNVTANIKNGSLIDSANVNVQFSGDNKVTLQSIINKHAGIDANSVQVLNGTTIINAASPDKTGGGVIDGEGMNVILVTPHNASDFSDPKTAYDSLHVAEGSTLTINANTKDQDGNLINSTIPNQYDLRGIVTRGMGVANASDWTDGTLTIDGNLNETLGSGHSSAIMARNLTINKTGNVNILTQQDNEHDGFENSIVGASSVFNGFHAGVIALNVGGIQSSNIQAHDSSLIDNGTLKIVRKDVPATNKADGKVWAPLIVMGTYGTNPVKYTMNVGEGATLDLQDQASFVSPALYTGKVMTNTPFAGLINMYGTSSNDVLSFTKPAYVNLQRTGSQTGTLIRLEGNNDSNNAGNMIQLNGVTPGGTPLSQWDTGNYTDNPSNTWRIQNLTAHDAKGMNAILGYDTLKGSKDNYTLKFLDSNGAVTLTMDKTGQVVYTRNSDGQVVNDPQGTVQQEVQLNNFLNNFNFWTPQRISFGNKAAISQSIYAPTDVQQGTTKTVKPTVFNKPADSPQQDQIKTTYTKTADTPAWVSVDENTGELTLTPTADNSKVGMYNVPVLVTYTDQTNSGESSTQTVFAPVFVTDGNETVVWPKDPEGNLNGAIVITTDPSAIKAHETSDNNMDLKADAAVKSIDEYQMDTVNTISTTPTSIAKDSKGITIAWGTEPSTVVSEATKGETVKGTVNVTFDKDSQPFTDDVLDQDSAYTTTSDLNIDAPGAVAQETAPATPVKATAGTQLTDDQFKALVNTTIPASEINHATLQSVDKDNAVVRITFNDKDAKGQNTYLDVKVPASYVDTTTPASDADTYNPHYNPVNVNQGGKVETGVPSYGEGVTAPTGTTYTIPEGTKLPDGVTATIDPNTGNVTVTTSDNTPEGPIFVPVTVNYPDGSQETIDAPIAVGANTFIGTDYSVSVDTNLDNLHETTANSMNPDAKDAITKITWWNNNDVRAGKNLDGTVIYNKANGTGDLNDVTVEWINPINTNVDKATMDEVLPGSNTSTVDTEKNPAIKITYGANSQLIKDTGSGLFTTQGGSQTARWYGNGVTVQGADAKNPAKPVDVTAGVNELTSDQVAALIDTTNLDKLTANKPVSYTWATPLKKGDTQGTVKITFSDKAANGQATYLNIELPAGSINVTDPTDVINPTDPTDPSQKDLFTTVTRTIEVTNPETGKTTSTPQSVIFARTKTIDKITGETVSYGEYKVWDGTKQTDKTTGSFAEFDVPQIKDYTSLVDGNVATKVAADNNVTPETKSSTVNVTYTQNPTDADKYTPEGQDVHTNVGETPNASEGIANKGDLPTGTKYSWKTTPDVSTPGTKDATVVVTYPDGSKDEVPVHVIVDTPEVHYSENATGTPIITEQGVEPNPADGIGNKDELDPKTTYTWTNGEPDVSKIGVSTVTITVHYPDGKTQNVDTPLIVTGTEIPTNPNDPSQSDLFTYVTRNISTTTPDGKTTTQTQKATFARTKTVDKNGKTSYSEYTVYNTETNKLTNDTETTLPEVPVTQIDGYFSEVNGVKATEVSAISVNASSKPEDVNVTYVETDAHKYTPEGQPINTDKGVMPNPGDGIKNKGDLPTGTTYTWTNGEPDVNTPGTKPVTITVHYPDGTTDTVTTTITVTDDADKYTPEGQDVHTNVGDTPDASEGIANKGDLPDGTKYTWKTTPDVTTPGTKDATIVVTYPDGSQDEVPVHVIVDTPEVHYSENATGTPIVTDKGVMPNPADGIGNKDELDPKTTYTWTNGEPDVNKIGKTTVTITVHYPDGKTQNVDTPLIVTGTEIPTNPNDPSQSDLFTYVTRNINITTPEGKTTTQTQKATFARTKTVDKNGDTSYSAYTVYNTETNKLTNDTETTLPEVPVTQIDGYFSEVNGTKATKVSSLSVNASSKPEDVNVTYVETDAHKYTPEPNPITTDKGHMPDPSEGIGNKGDLPTGTTYTWTNGEPDVTTPGTKSVTITVQYPDGTTDTVTTTITVTDDADKYTPEPAPITTDKGHMPDPSEGIGNKGDLPTGTTYTWTN